MECDAYFNTDYDCDVLGL